MNQQEGRQQAEQYVLACLISDPYRTRFELYDLKIEWFTTPEMRAIATALIRIRKMPRRWPPRSTRLAWRRVDLELLLRGGAAGRRVVALHLPRDMARAVGTSLGLGQFMARISQPERPVRRQREPGEDG